MQPQDDDVPLSLRSIEVNSNQGIPDNLWPEKDTSLPTKSNTEEERELPLSCLPKHEEIPQLTTNVQTLPESSDIPQSLHEFPMHGRPRCEDGPKTPTQSEVQIVQLDCSDIVEGASHGGSDTIESAHNCSHQQPHACEIQPEMADDASAQTKCENTRKSQTETELEDFSSTPSKEESNDQTYTKQEASSPRKSTEESEAHLRIFPPNSSDLPLAGGGNMKARVEVRPVAMHTEVHVKGDVRKFYPWTDTDHMHPVRQSNILWILMLPFFHYVFEKGV